MALAASSKFWLLTFAGYFACQVLVRVLTGGALGLDEAQIMRHGQYLSWGYGAQPPLYAWLQYFVFQVTGNSIFGLSLLKNAFLFASVILWFLLFRREVGVAKAGFLASAFVLIPQFSWESQRALTHSVLAGTATAAFYYWFWTSLKKDRSTRLTYGGLGLVLAAGILAKATFLIVPFATLFAAFSMPSIRAKLSLKGLGLSAIVCTLLVSPYALWSLLNREAAFASAWKFAVAEKASFAEGMLQGMGSFALALVSFVILAVIVLSVIWFGFRQPNSPERGEFFTWLVRAMICAVGIIALAVIVSKTTNVKDRWLQASLMPLGALLVWLCYDRISNLGRRVLGYTLVVLALIVMAGQPYHSLAGRAYRASPYDQFAVWLASETGTETPIIAGDWIAGNLIYQDQGFEFTRPTEPLDRDNDYILVSVDNWNNPSEQKQLDYLRSLGFQTGPFSTFEAPYRLADDETFLISIVPLTAN